MPSLIAKSPLAGRAAARHAGLTLAEEALATVTSVAVQKGGGKALTKGLKALGLSFPAPNRVVESGAARIVWTGRDQAFLINAAPALVGAALADQTDGWACLVLDGAGAEDVLARLYPIDLRAPAFTPGSAARAPLNHMPSVLMRRQASFEILIFRSMALTAWHEIEAAMVMRAARLAHR